MEFSVYYTLTCGQTFSTWSIELNTSHMNICMQFSSVKHEILYISPVKMRVQPFHNTIVILCISYEYLCGCFPTWNYEFYVLQIWKTRMLSLLHEMWCSSYFPYKHLSIDFSTQNMEFWFFHICKLGHWFPLLNIE